MRTIEIDESIYYFLLGHASASGGTLSDVLRRLLEIPTTGNGKKTEFSPMVSPPASQSGTPSNNQVRISAFLNSPSFLVQGNAVGRFLSVLSWLCKQHREAFEKVLSLNGRKRRYFAKSSEELEASGNSVMPKRIPDTPYWVITNSPTQLKKLMVAHVMRVLGYDPSSIHVVSEAVR